MSVKYIGASTPPAAHSPIVSLVEVCAWCGRVPLSCIACIECFELFCSQTCHQEFVHDEDEQRSNAAAIAAEFTVN